MSIEDRQFDLKPKAENSPQLENLEIEQTDEEYNFYQSVFDFDLIIGSLN